MIAVGGVLTGYNGSFEFKEPGQKYEDHPYIGMRVVCKFKTRKRKHKKKYKGNYYLHLFLYSTDVVAL